MRRFAPIATALAIALAWEVGLFRRLFDSRSVVEDGVVGADYRVVRVDGRLTDRIEHGFVVTKVPLALIEPGDRMLTLWEGKPGEKMVDGFLEWQTRVEKGMDYRIEKGPDGSPRLIARE